MEPASVVKTWHHWMEAFLDGINWLSGGFHHWGNVQQSFMDQFYKMIQTIVFRPTNFSRSHFFLNGKSSRMGSFSFWWISNKTFTNTKIWCKKIKFAYKQKHNRQFAQMTKKKRKRKRFKLKTKKDFKK